ncbi:hypothetical protein GC169_09815 [bacterium]|nr:hypothetical protein [bacterium]
MKTPDSNSFGRWRIVRPLVSGLALAAAVMGVPASLGAASAQAAYSVPRTPSGAPDLQGVWTSASLTSLQRAEGVSGLVLPEAEAQRIEGAAASAAAAANRPTDPNAPPPEAGRNVGGYNAFYIDRGAQLARVRGEARTSWIVDPPDGRLPYSEAGRKIYIDTLTRRRTVFDGPEDRPIAERCLVGFGSTGSPPMMNVSYNNHYQFVQTADALMILVEMNHDVRVIPIGAGPVSSGPVSSGPIISGPKEDVRRWLGRSVGRWEGDTLVVETTGFHDDDVLRSNMSQSFYISKDARVTERFTRVAEDEILYAFSVEDPAVYSQTWRGEMPLRRSDGPVYEYACHEGNYSLPGILAGARMDERRGVTTRMGLDGNLILDGED